MQNIKKYFMTLALLLTAVTGAWAQSSLNVVELEEVPADWETDNSLVTAADLPGFNASTLDKARAWTGAPAEGFATLIYAIDDNLISYVEFYNGEPNSGTFSTMPKNQYFIIISYSIAKIYYTAGPTEWELKPDTDKKVWTLTNMPASNVELQVEYFAESNLFLGKEALADQANIAVKNGETTVEFDDDGKSTTTVTEGNTVTATYTGTKKLLGMKVEKKAAEPVADIVWDATNVTDLYVEGSEMWYEKEGIMLSGNGDQVQAVWDSFNDPTMVGIAFGMFASGGFTFMAPTGKAFTKIEMTLTGSGGWEEAYVDGNLGTGWAFNPDMEKQIFTVTWKGSAAASTVKLLTDAGYFSGAANVKSIAFYLSE